MPGPPGQMPSVVPAPVQGSAAPNSPVNPPPGRRPVANETTNVLHPRKKPLMEVYGPPGAFAEHISAIQQQPWDQVRLIPNTPNKCLDALDLIMKECPPLYLPTATLFSDPATDTNDFKVWHIDPSVKDYWKDNVPENVQKMDQCKETIFQFHCQQDDQYGYHVKDLFVFRDNSYKGHSDWEDPDHPGRYQMVQRRVEEMTKLSPEALLREALRENPHWHKLHPIPNLLF